MLFRFGIVLCYTRCFTSSRAIIYYSELLSLLKDHHEQTYAQIKTLRLDKVNKITENIVLNTCMQELGPLSQKN